MIEFIPERLPLEQEAKLRRWLNNPESVTFQNVLRAKCQFLQAEALQKALHAKDGDQSSLLSQSALEAAARYDTARNIIEELRAQPNEERFHLAKLKTTHAYIPTDPTTDAE